MYAVPKATTSRAPWNCSLMVPRTTRRRRPGLRFTDGPDGRRQPVRVKELGLVNVQAGPGKALRTMSGDTLSTSAATVHPASPARCRSHRAPQSPESSSPRSLRRSSRRRTRARARATTARAQPATMATDRRPTVPQGQAEILPEGEGRRGSTVRLQPRSSADERHADGREQEEQARRGIQDRALAPPTSGRFHRRRVHAAQRNSVNRDEKRERRGHPRSIVG